MRNVLYILVFCISFQVLLAQETSSFEEPIVEMKDADTPPAFYAGEEALYDFIRQHLKKPNIPQLIGKIFLSFIVEKDGTLTSISIVRDVGFGTGSEAERVLQLSPKWIPGRKNGKVVRVKYYLPIPIQTN